MNRALLACCCSIFLLAASSSVVTGCVGNEAPATDDLDPGIDGGDPATADLESGDLSLAPCAAYVPPIPLTQQAGGSVMSKPNIIAVYFADSDPAVTSKLDTFITRYVTSPVWKEQVAEYGVGDATVGKSLHLKDLAPTNISNVEIVNFLYAKFKNVNSEFGFADANNLYVIFYPAKTRVKQGPEVSCVAFDGFHNELATPDGTEVSFAVVVDCATVFGDVTTAASHEIAEAVTDPLPQSMPSYRNLQSLYAGWTIAFRGTEVGDLCEHIQDLQINDPAIGVYQRSWSNKAAMAHQNPCVPVPAASPAYFNSTPVLPDMIDMTDEQGNAISAEGVKIAAGKSKVVDVHLWGNCASKGVWTVKAAEVPIPGNQRSLSFVWLGNNNKGKDGDVLHLTISVAKGAPAGGFTTFLMTSSNGKQDSNWAGVVGF